ncbi:MAG: hypothetical protein V3V34_11730 [Kiloniellales bacterium]
MIASEVVGLIQALIKAFDAGEKTADEVIAEMRRVGAAPESGSDAKAAALAADASPPNPSQR